MLEEGSRMTSEREGNRRSNDGIERDGEREQTFGFMKTRAGHALLC
jgi:hypothetical protein